MSSHGQRRTLSFYGALSAALWLGLFLHVFQNHSALSDLVSMPSWFPFGNITFDWIILAMLASIGFAIGCAFGAVGREFKRQQMLASTNPNAPASAKGKAKTGWLDRNIFLLDENGNHVR